MNFQPIENLTDLVNGGFRALIDTSEAMIEVRYEERGSFGV
jgi:hypothetical protein